MYDDYDGPQEAVARDEREGWMQTYVQLDRDLKSMHERRRDLDEQIDKASAKQREVRSMLADALGFNNTEKDLKAAYAEVMKR